MAYLSLFLVAALAAVPSCLGAGAGSSPPAPKPGNPKYTDLNSTEYWPQGTTGQWAITIQRRNAYSEPWAPHICNATAYGAPCNAPVLRDHTEQEVKITFTKRNASVPLRTWKMGTPIELLVRLDYMPVSQVDRGWRKKNQVYPGCGWHVKWEVATFPYNDASATWDAPMEAIWALSAADEVTDGVLYPEVCVRCQFADGTQDYCQCDRRNAGVNTLTVETEVYGSITPAMRGAAIAMSVFSPIFLIIYATADVFYYKRTGRSLRIGSI
ncbi:hypothetical protein HYH03_012347 [Edaphochlamys debaryana]|uniref:Uncharacterized protein n=1 Tax=Edaphochlamys debaryana TaxID=47281 RepID=A0A835XS67_9CHLO|nr:hypothetical protein HYH03_012347 [Edaphochlamys debaryana]|eukprot:KAG2489121.1 hypothetical protein HYH03_012347 [Edaphochlamys debaryana]